MWKISPQTLYRASLSNPFGFDGAQFARERMGPRYVNKNIRESQLPKERSMDVYQQSIDQQGNK
jgi:hypothetical protein